MRFCSSTRGWPGVSFLCRSKRSGLLRTKENAAGVAALLTGGSIVDWIRRTTAYALFHCMDQRVAPPKCLWQMPVALQSEAAPRFRQWVQTRRTWKWWCRWVVQWDHSFCSAMLLVWNPALPWPKILLAGQRHLYLDHRGKATYPLLWPIRKASLRVCTCLQGTGIRPCLVSDDQTNCEFVDVGGGHQARLLLRRTTIGAQSVVKTMELLVGNLTAAVVIFGNHLQTTIQRLHIGNSQIRARCLGKAQAEVQLNSLNCRNPELTWVEPTDALVDAASGEGDAGAPLKLIMMQSSCGRLLRLGTVFFFLLFFCSTL